MPQERVCLGAVAGAHGVRGLVRIKSFTADAGAVADYGPLEDESGQRRFAVEVVGNAKGVVVARIAGIADRDAAEALKGTRLYVARAALPLPGEEEYYHADLIGLAVVLEDGTLFGQVKAVHDYGAGDSIEIDRPGAASVMLPFTRAAVPVIDLAGGRLVVSLPEGLLTEARDAAEGEAPDEP